jgi:sugar/nucleoside kinase (ribokinase family)
MNRNELADYLEKNLGSIVSLRAVTGFDGFVDEMISVVDKRQDLESFERVEDISRFGDLIKAAAGHSSLREIVVNAVHPGGCAVNMGDGLAAAGVKVDTFATLGEPVHPAFADYGQLATLHSWGREPGRTLAFEFADGKLMFSSVTQLAEFDPVYVKKRLMEEAFQDCCKKASIVALTDWSMYPHMTSVWKVINEEVFSILEGRPWLFVDLVDPSSRSDADIKDMLEVLKLFDAHMCAVLGLNQNEANILSRMLGIPVPPESEKESSSEQAAALRAALNLTKVVIHGHAYAVCAHAGGMDSVDGPFCDNPLKSTGAGDRFNAGFALGLALNLLPVDCLLLAVASSGYFVRHARSASAAGLVSFIRDWANDRLD